jgi:hypothetical protein
MIDNIWHLRGSVELPPDVTDAITIERIEEFLVKQAKPVRNDTNSSITFYSPLWENPLIANNGLVLAMYDQGNFRIEPAPEGRHLRYDLRSLHGLMFCLAGALLFLVFVGFFRGFAAAVPVCLFVFGWLYGGNMLLAWVRIPSAIRNVVRGS